MEKWIQNLKTPPSFEPSKWRSGYNLNLNREKKKRAKTDRVSALGIHFSTFTQITMSDHQRILLSEAASKHLLEAGECWMIAGKSSHPEIAGRIVLHLLAIPKAQADAACEVALGLRKPGKRIITPAIAKDAPQAPSRARKCPSTETTHQDHLPT